ncbi:MAG TPA: DNA recombination protein RmuC, partial [Arcobacter sp.]|nr:DNA recombination protein RmuC [Arcobacter sp.]
IQVSQDANNLALALKGENKTQGDWGEMILSRVLEQSGLKEGREYSVQGSFKSQDGKNQRPDVVVHLPAKKDIVIDSKVSLTSYIEYTQASNEEEKNIAIKDMMISLNSHIKDLSSKKYEDLPELGTLDFVLMFIPIEGAFMLASSSDNKLFNLAFQSNIMIVSPSTLFVSLRTIENIWKVQDQNDNAKLIAKKAADLYDKFEGFVGDMEDLGKSIQKSNITYENAFSKLSTGRGNLMRRTEEFKKLGVKPKKSLKLIDEKE